MPWFVCWLDGNGARTEPGTGKPDFRVVDTRKLAIAITRKLCWICGGAMGRHMAFVIGPMCAVSRVSSEPPCHRACAEYAVCACPFLIHPRMVRNDRVALPTNFTPDGHIDRNPGVSAIWMTRGYGAFVSDGSQLFRLGDPEEIMWLRQGRAATRPEIIKSIDDGMPLLREKNTKPGHEEELQRQYRRLLQMVPAS